MIGNFIQPKKISVDKNLSLVKYYPYYKRTLNWYQDLEVCKQVDNIDSIYDIDKLKKMYKYLSKNGECYYIKLFENGRYYLIGDVTLYEGEISIVINKSFQNRHFGRKVILKIIERAKEVGYEEIRIRIFDFNIQSKKMFLSIGFEKISSEEYIYKIKL